MGLPRSPFRLLLPALLLPALASLLTPPAAQAGPLVRRAQERRACQEFAGKLQQASGNPAMAQQVYQQGVLQLVQRFGENPCGDIPAPMATSGTPAAPTAPAASAPAAAPAGTPATPSGTAAPGGSSAKAGSAAPASATAQPSTTAPAAAPSAQQQQACQQFASKLQAAAASGGAAAAQQTYAMGLQKLTGMFGSNPCPAVRPPQ